MSMAESTRRILVRLIAIGAKPGALASAITDGRWTIAVDTPRDLSADEIGGGRMIGDDLEHRLALGLALELGEVDAHEHAGGEVVAARG